MIKDRSAGTSTKRTVEPGSCIKWIPLMQLPLFGVQVRAV
jgi:hypothetical protein